MNHSIISQKRGRNLFLKKEWRRCLSPNNIAAHSMALHHMAVAYHMDPHNTAFDLPAMADRASKHPTRSSRGPTSYSKPNMGTNSHLHTTGPSSTSSSPSRSRTIPRSQSGHGSSSSCGCPSYFAFHPNYSSPGPSAANFGSTGLATIRA